MLVNDSTNSNVVIELKNIKKTYDNKMNVLNGIDLCLCKGEVAVIEGKSGAGKSTLMNIIGFLDDFNEGEYLLHNETIKKKNYSKIRAQMIGFVFQAYHLIESITVRDNIVLPFLYSDYEFDNNAKKYYEQLLEKFGLKELEYKKASLLSGGEKQRVAIVRALIKNPEIIIADEPTGNLDVDNTELVIDAFRQLKDEGKVVIIVTHDVNIAKENDRKLYLRDGKIIE